jgi:hypothetical protein
MSCGAGQLRRSDSERTQASTLSCYIDALASAGSPLQPFGLRRHRCPSLCYRLCRLWAQRAQFQQRAVLINRPFALPKFRTRGGKGVLDMGPGKESTEWTTGETNRSNSSARARSIDQSKIAYQNLSRIHGGGCIRWLRLSLTATARMVPQSDTVAFDRCPEPGQGYYIKRVRSGVLSRHRIPDRCMPSRCAEIGVPERLVRPQATTISRPARRTPSSFR